MLNIINIPYFTRLFLVDRVYFTYIYFVEKYNKLLILVILAFFTVIWYIIAVNKFLGSIIVVVASLLFIPSGLAYGVSGDGRVNVKLTPGDLNPAVTQDNIKKTICVPGYSKSIRPAESYTYKLKMKQLRSGYNYKGLIKASLYEEDHMVPLSIGGAPSSELNLWPEPWDIYPGAREKDKLEFLVYKSVCSGKMSLSYGQSLFLNGNWESSYFKYFSK